MGGMEAYLSDYCIGWVKDLKEFYDEPSSTFLHYEFIHWVLVQLRNM